MKVAFVTGSSRGIGRGIADLLHEESWQVIYSGTKQDRPDHLPADRDYFPCDISREEDRQAALQYIVSRYHRIDLLVNNAGVAPLVRRDLLEMTEESFDRVIGINLKGTLFMCQLFAREMIAERVEGIPDWQPRIVNIGSMSAYTSSVSRGEYCISKAGVGMVTKLFADRLASEGKIITYAITFDTGKATIKPESTGEINRITKIMQEDPTIKFEVQGHCDNTGSDAVNDPLSQKRADAIVTALVANGIPADRLSTVGKGAHEPIADNSTDEGRAQNRRVEFVKK